MIEVSVIGNSMEPSINDGDLLYFNLINDISEVNVNDVVLCNHPFLRNIQIIKRVKKTINGKFFVIGDNARSFESSDSRSFGLLSESKIIAKLN
tara:strand:+ start:1140 stop:1421 length:282 start_codon:yes stop_codon:yes gene_type:complete